MPPHELKPKSTAATSPLWLVTKTGPLSLVHESSISISATCTDDPQWSMHVGGAPGLQIITTGSNAAIVRATSA